MVTEAITKACDICRKRKIRCDPAGDTCLQCLKSKSTCYFTPINVQRRPRRIVGQKKFEELEKRLQLMEHKLACVTGLTESEHDQPSILEQDQLHSITASADAVESNFDWAQLPMAENNGFLTPEVLPGIHQAPAMLDTPSFPYDTPHRDECFLIPHWKLVPANDIFARRIFQPIPSREKVLGLVNKAFEGYSTSLPLFNRRDFMRRLDGPDTNLQDSSWWACVNVMLALALRFEAFTSPNKELEDQESWGYFQNALSVATELTMVHTSLAAVQALAGLAIIVQGTSNARTGIYLTAAAMKLAQSMNLHREYQGPPLGAEEIEQRRKVFWILYSIDKDISLTTGNPPVQDDDDIGVELPAEFSSLEPSCSLKENDFFRQRIELAMVQGQIYKRLCTVKSSKKPRAQRLAEFYELERKLWAWKARVLVRWPPSAIALQNLETTYIAAILHSIILRLSYFNTLSALHQAISSLPDENVFQSSPSAILSPPMPTSISRVEEARKALELLLVAPQGDYAWTWVVLHIFVLATKILLSNIILHPSALSTQPDIKLIKPLLNLLGNLSKTGLNNEVPRIYEYCFDLYRQANTAVGHSRKEARSLQQNTVRAGKENLEDFIKRIEGLYQETPDFMIPSGL